MDDFSSPGRASTASAPELLTPRSKVAKMLADIDNASSPTSNQISQQTPGTRHIQPKATMPFQSDDESDDEIRKPVGRAARRMLSGAGIAQTSRLNSSPPSLLNSPAQHTTQSRGYLDSATPRPSKDTPRPYLQPSTTHSRSDLFVSPAKSTGGDSTDELPDLPLINRGRLAELVAQKRAERLAKESEDQQRSLASSDMPEEILEDSQAEQNPEIDRIMSDAAKPTRKASKKAMLEMERETQRIARQQALTHEMKVRKKFTTADLFARFNFRPVGAQESNPTTDGDDAASSSVPNSDGFEAMPREPVSTPPSSPPTPLDRQRALVEKGALSKMISVREDSLASLAELDAGEFPDISTVLHQGGDNIFCQTGSEKPKRGLRLARLGKKAVPAARDDSSDDELEILKQSQDDLDMFERAKRSFKGGNSDSHAIHTLKHLAHIHADAVQPRRGKKGATRPSVNPSVLDAQLRLRAKEQARAQQFERIAELKAKGIDVQTSEQREQEAEDFENMLEKARQEAVALRKAEKAAAREGGELGADASDDESEDGDYEGSGDDDDAEGLIEASADESGEDEEELEEEEDQDDEIEHAEDGEQTDLAAQVEPAESQMVDQQSIQNGFSTDRALTPAHGGLIRPTHIRKPRNARVVIDDDEDSDQERLAKLTPAHGTQGTQSDEQDPFAAFNFGGMGNNAALMSPTQAFHATMQTPTQLTQQDSMDVLRTLVPLSSSAIPSLPASLENDLHTPHRVTQVASSQVPDSQKVNLVWDTQPPETPVPALRRNGATSQIETPGWEPSQDVGLPSSWQARDMLDQDTDVTVDHDTQSTMRLRISESPVPANSMPKRRRFVQRQGAMIDSSDEEETGGVLGDKPKPKDAFREMARKRKEALSATELAEAEREMKQMMDDQAEESEDEYAGLGGDDFVAPETEQDREMIDSSHIDVDERALAAHFAERQRVADEADASKLYKDLMTGALRRKQANMFDLGEDEDDLAVRRRQMRQREEARKRKLLLQDDHIAGLAEGKLSKGKDAFLKAIADDDEPEDEVLDPAHQGEGSDEPQSQTNTQSSQDANDAAIPLQEVSGNKRRLDEVTSERPPAKYRRTQASAFRAPTSLLEVKESVSFLLEEADSAKFGPSAMEVETELDSDQESLEAEEEENQGEDEDDVAAELARQNDGGFAPNPVSLMPPPRLPASQRRTAMKAAVVDRLSLKRGSSTSEGAAARTAWGPSALGGFKVPSLLRRATTNVAIGANERGVTTSSSVSRENSGVKMGGTKKSSLAYQARAEERKAQVEASMRRRAENTARIAQLRRGNSGMLGSGLSGRFE